MVFMKVNDLMIYLVGTGEYDELMRALSHSSDVFDILLESLHEQGLKHLRL